MDRSRCLAPQCCRDRLSHPARRVLIRVQPAFEHPQSDIEVAIQETIDLGCLVGVEHTGKALRLVVSQTWRWISEAFKNREHPRVERVVDIHRQLAEAWVTCWLRYAGSRYKQHTPLRMREQQPLW